MLHKFMNKNNVLSFNEYRKRKATEAEIQKNIQENRKQQERDNAPSRIFGLGRLVSPETEELRLNRIHRGTKE
jgi:hypothetical protein